MKKIIFKIMAIVLIMMLIIVFSSHVSFAERTGEVIKKVDDKVRYIDPDLNYANSVAGKVLTAVRNISIVVAVIAISIIGVKYMVGSVEERAGYKKSLIPLAVGIIIVASAATIMKAFYSIGK